MGNFKTGTYTGDGNATQGIVGLGFQPSGIIIWSQVHAASPAWKVTPDLLNCSFYSDAQIYPTWINDTIISLDANGFTVGDSTGGPDGNVLNALGRIYTYVAFN